MIDDLVEDLKSDEGWSPHAYQDHLGFWTIGYGFLVDDRKDAGLPEQIADAWLTYAITERWNHLVAREPWISDQPEDVRRALGNMVYQLGVGGLLGFKNTLRLLKEGKRGEAADNALQSKWATQTPKRAKRVTDLLRGNV